MLRDDVPEISFFDADPAPIIQGMISRFEAAYQDQTGQSIVLYPGDPLRILLYTFALEMSQAYALANLNAKRNFLQYADGAWLDNLSATRGGPVRLPAARASAQVQFDFSAPLTRPVTIPQGTRVSPDGNTFFATTVTTVAPTGVGSVIVDVVAQDTGTQGNGFTAGALKILVDPIPYVQQVANAEVTQGGADVETDDAYRERIYLSPEGYSVAGPELAYRYHALAYSQLIEDVVVTSPAPGEVRVVPVMVDGEAPTQDFLDDLLAYLSARDKRPLTDSVMVDAPTFVSYDITLTYWIAQSAEDRETSIRAAVEQAVQDYALWQRAAVGRDITPDALVQRIIAAGAKRVEITSPTYTVLPDDGIAIAQTSTVDYGGIESD